MRTSMTMTRAFAGLLCVTLLSLVSQLCAQCPTTADFRVIGSGTSGTTGVPRLASGGMPVPGQAMSFEVSRARPHAPGALYYGFDSVNVPLPSFGASIYISPVSLLETFSLDANGQATNLAALAPLSSAFCGLEVHLQAIVFDPLAAGGIAFTGSVGVTFGTPATEPLVQVYGLRLGPYTSGAERSLLDDVDGDGMLDALTLGDDSITVSLGLGDGTFGAYTEFAMSNPSGAACADMNNDGIPDLVVTDRGTGTVRVALGTGGGNFAAPLSYPGPNGSSAVVISDVNSDGSKDAIVCGQVSSTIDVLLGSPSGALGAPTAYSALGARPRRLVLADLNSDGIDDVLVSGFVGSSCFAVLMGAADGTFSTPSCYSITCCSFIGALAVGDFNEDGHPDVVVAQDSSATIYSGSQSGALDSPRDITYGVLSYSVAVGDLDADGHADIVFGKNKSLSVAAGNGDGTFQPIVFLRTTSLIRDMKFADLNGDGFSDVLATEGEHGTVVLGPVSDLSDPLGSEGSSNVFLFATVGDLDADGIPDVVSVNRESNLATVLLGTGDGDLVAQPSFVTGADPRQPVIEDVNEDGWNDLLVADSLNGDVWIHLGLGTGNFAAPTLLSLGGSPRWMAAADLDQDGHADLVVAEFDTDRVSTFLGQGDGTFVAGTQHPVGNGPREGAMGDLDSDGNVDLVISNRLSRDVCILLGTSSGSFQAAIHYAMPGNQEPLGVAIGDVTGDSIPDLALGLWLAFDAAVLPGLGDGTFGPMSTFFGPGGAFSVHIVDLNGDGDQDMVFGDDDGIEFVVYLGLGQGNFGSLRVLTTYGTRSISIVDLDGDGDRDFLMDQRGSVRVILNRLFH